MKNILLGALLILMLIIGCESPKAPKSYNITDKLELRQLVSDKDEVISSRGSFFLIAGSYLSDKSYKETVKVFAKVDGSYRFIEADLKQIRVHILDSLDKPYIRLELTDEGEGNNTEIIDRVGIDLKHDWNDYLLHIYCSSKYLPENLIPINIK